MSITETRTILIADLVGSTSHATKGDAVRGAKFLEDATRPIRTAIETQSGTVIKFTGDGYIATFKSARHALICADAIRDHFIRQQNTPGGFVVDGVRVVVNTADVVIKDDDLVGDAIIVTARLEKHVPTNQVYVTEATRAVVGVSDFVFQSVGEMTLKGRELPVKVFTLENTDMSFIEHGAVLLVTDLHHFRKASEALSPVALNDWLSTWVDLHRQATEPHGGHIRHFVSDMLMVTFQSVETAVQAVLRLSALCDIHNQQANEFTKYQFKGAIAIGDLILTGNGIVGKLVNEVFEVLSITPRKEVYLSENAFKQLDEKAEQFLKSIELELPETPRKRTCYQLSTETAAN